MISPLEKYYETFESIDDYERIAVRYNVKIEGPALKPEDDPEVVEILAAAEGETKKTLALDVLYGDKEKTDEDVTKAVEAGEDPKFIARRMVIFASEDIGLAGNGALSLATACFQAVERVGMPESGLI